MILTSKSGVKVEVNPEYIVFYHDQITTDDKFTLLCLGKDFYINVIETQDEIRSLIKRT